MMNNELNLKIATPGARLGSHVIEILLAFLTLGIGWLIWSFVVWSKGTTPGHQVLKLTIHNEETGEIFSWGQMFLREFIYKGLVIPIATMLSFGIAYLVDSFMVLRDDRKTLHDRMARSIVVQN